MLTKVCSKCKQEKSIKEFYKNKSQKDGLCGWCKDCINKKDRERQKDPVIRAEKNRRQRERREDPVIKAEENRRQRKRKRNQIEVLSDGYIKQVIKQMAKRMGIALLEVTQEMINDARNKIINRRITKDV